ncbi:MAG TPA: glycosyltransferase [Thermodesulfovibrionales bacterium]|nr:glycosyltransferase [Thermodesulfovibrionales bacterium]
MTTQWLIISYFAHIDAMAPSHHVDDRIPFFREKGVAVDLLSSPCGIPYGDLSHTRIPSPAPSGIRYEARYFLRRRTKKRFWFKFWETLLLLPVYPFYFVEKLLLRLDSTWSWFLTASLSALVLAIRKRPAVIYSTGGPVSAHIAAMVASRITKIPHIAEFQDPLVHQYAAPGKFERHFIEKVERAILRTAAASVFLTKKAAENAARRNPGIKNITCIYAGAVPPGAMPCGERGPTLRIAHFGSLGGSRNLNSFFDALFMLFREDPSLAGALTLDLYGNNSREVSRRMEQFPLKGILAAKGKVKRQKALEAMSRADLLLLIQNTDDVSFETIPSKVYEYLHTGRPVLALVYRNRELQSMLEESGHVVVQADNAVEIAQGLKTCIARWRENAFPLPCTGTSSPYTVERAVGELMRLAQSARREE